MSSKPTGFRNIPPPPGSKAGNPYTRFIPREELGDFASWQPDSFGGGAPGGPAAAAAAAAAAATAEPTAADWQGRVQAARQAGYQEGYRDGTAALENFKAAFAQQATAQVGALLEAFDQQLQALDGELAQALARAAVQLAEQVLRAELVQNPAVVARVATEAVNAVMLSARAITVHVHPQDLPLVAEGADEALRARSARLHADPAIARGGVRVVSDVGTIDAQLPARWAQAAAALGGAPAADTGEPA